jgi:hypothetical protein
MKGVSPPADKLLPTESAASAFCNSLITGGMAAYPIGEWVIYAVCHVLLCTVSWSLCRRPDGVGSGDAGCRTCWAVLWDRPR